MDGKLLRTTWLGVKDGGGGGNEFDKLIQQDSLLNCTLRLWTKNGALLEKGSEEPDLSLVKSRVLVNILLLLLVGKSP